MSNKNGPQECLILKTDTDSCLYELTVQYLLFLGSYQGYLQPTCIAQNALIPNPDRAITFTVGIADMRSLIDSVGLNGADYAEHSGKRGGASYAAKVGLIEEEIRDIGNWKSTATARLYIDKCTPLRMKKHLKMLKDL